MRRRSCLIRLAAAPALGGLVGVGQSAASAESALPAPSAPSSKSAGLALLYPRHAGQRDTLGGYAPELLALALAGAERRYELAQSPSTMAQGRAMVEMLKPEPPIDVFWTVTTPQRQQALLPIRIPIERGLFGWRVALVRRADAERFRELRRLSELAPLVAGQKHDWPDVGILRANGLTVQTSTQYESLFNMLSLARLDYFPRSVLEVRAELEAHAELDLVIEPHLVLRYPSALYFFVAPGRTQLAADITQGLERAQANGSFERLFQQHFRETIDALHLGQRRVFELRNPSLPADVPVQRRDWWLNAGRPAA